MTQKRKEKWFFLKTINLFKATLYIRMKKMSKFRKKSNSKKKLIFFINYIFSND